MDARSSDFDWVLSAFEETLLPGSSWPDLQRPLDAVIKEAITKGRFMEREQTTQIIARLMGETWMSQHYPAVTVNPALLEPPFMEVAFREALIAETHEKLLRLATSWESRVQPTPAFERYRGTVLTTFAADVQQEYDRRVRTETILQSESLAHQTGQLVPESNAATQRTAIPAGVPAPMGRKIAFLVTDIENSTKLWGRNPSAMQDAMIVHNTVVRAAVARSRGYEMRGQLDVFIVVYQTCQAALAAALDLQLALLEATWPAPLLLCPEAAVVRTRTSDVLHRGLRLRCGLHVGDPEIIKDAAGRTDYAGSVVVLAQQVANAGHGGQVLASAEFFKVVEAELKTREDVATKFLGKHTLQSGAEPVELYQLLPAQLQARQFAVVRTNNMSHSKVDVSRVESQPGAPNIGQEILALQRKAEEWNKARGGRGAATATRTAGNVTGNVTDQVLDADPVVAPAARLVKPASRVEVVGEALAGLFALRKDPQDAVKLLTLVGATLPLSLRRYVWSVKLRDDAHIAHCQTKMVQQAREMDLKDPSQSPINAMLTRAVSESFQHLLAPYRTPEIERRMVKVLNQYYVFKGTYEPRMMVFLCPLLMVYDNEPDVTLVSYLDRLLSLYTPSDTAQQKLCEDIVGELRYSDEDLFQHILNTFEWKDFPVFAVIQASVLAGNADALLSEDPAALVKRWVSNAFVGVVCPGALLFLWDQIMLLGWDVIVGVGHELLISLRRNLFPAATTMSMHDALNKGMLSAFTADVQEAFQKWYANRERGPASVAGPSVGPMPQGPMPQGPMPR